MRDSRVVIERHRDILAEAMAEIKAIIDAGEGQSIRGIVEGCIEEINELFNNPPANKIHPTHFHVKRGSSYEVLGDGEAQISTPGFTRYPGQLPGQRVIREGDTMVVYQAEDGKLFLRFPDEFNDGRFRKI